MASYLITGANRGLGLLMVSFLASKPATEVGVIIAAVRKSSEALENIVDHSGGRVLVRTVQVTDEESVRKLDEEMKKVLPNGLDVLINNAGIMHFSPKAELGIEVMYVGQGSYILADGQQLTTFRGNLHDHWNVNVNSVHLVTRALLPHLRNGEKKTIINM
jgi:NAD(P)-dependent dehydrogenase (short-subunit alcohol dehydrogenase family)